MVFSFIAMHLPFSRKDRSAFTLIELLVVIAIIAILAVVVILTLNPAELLRQSRDSNRLSDFSTISDAINIYNTNLAGAVGYSLGNASDANISVYDPGATSTVGDQCQNLGMPALPSAYTYNCSPSSSVSAVTNTGWIPINFTAMSGGAPFGVLPVDPINQTSSNLYYSYVTNGSTYEISATPESQKYSKTGESDGSGDPTLIEAGSGISALPDLGRGLAGYWPLNEGTGSTTIDWSGNGDPGTWSGTQSGASGYYSAGHIWSSAGTFDGTDDKISVPDAPALDFSNDFTVFLWFRTSTTTYSTGGAMLSKRGGGSTTVGYQIQTSLTNGSPSVLVGDATGYSGPSLSAAYNVFDMNWHNVILERAGSNILIYLDGALIYSGVTTHTGSVASTATLYIGSYGNGTYFPGTISDVRLYDYALPATVIQEMYNAEK